MRRPPLSCIVAALARGRMLTSRSATRACRSACPAARRPTQWTRTYTLEPGGRLEIVNACGPIDVSACGRIGARRPESIGKHARVQMRRPREALKALRSSRDAGGQATSRSRRGRDRSVPGACGVGRSPSRYYRPRSAGSYRLLPNENGSVSLRERARAASRLTTTNGAHHRHRPVRRGDRLHRQRSGSARR